MIAEPAEAAELRRMASEARTGVLLGFPRPWPIHPGATWTPIRMDRDTLHGVLTLRPSRLTEVTRQIKEIPR